MLPSRGLVNRTARNGRGLLNTGYFLVESLDLFLPFSEISEVRLELSRPIWALLGPGRSTRKGLFMDSAGHSSSGAHVGQSLHHFPGEEISDSGSRDAPRPLETHPKMFDGV